MPGEVMLIQQGARRNYVYARQLAQAGLLHSVLCDAARANAGDGSILDLAAKFVPRLAGPARRRTIGGVEASRVYSSVLPNLAAVARFFMHEERAYALADEALAFSASLRGLRDASVVVNYHGNGGSYLDRARRAGATIVTDFVVTPKYLEIEHAERQRWSGWEPATATPAVIAFYRRRMTHLLKISGVYLCPSQTVARDLADFDGFDSARVRIAPYGVSGVLLRPGEPVRGRVLFAGAAGLRKGIPYLAQAAEILRERGAPIEIVVAGAVTPIIRGKEETRHLTFLGELDKDRIANEFACADVYCLPSLAEGSATSVFEALANGLPVVTTASSGSVVEDGVEGFVVPERAPEALADAIQRIVENRELRDAMSKAGREAAIRYSDEACGDRFVAVIRELLDQRSAPERATTQGN